MIGLAMMVAANGYMSGTALYDSCKQDRVSCMAYVIGAVDGYLATVREPSRLICLTGGVTRNQITDIAIKYLEDNPDKRPFAAASSVLLAVSNAFPCPKP